MKRPAAPPNTEFGSPEKRLGSILVPSQEEKVPLDLFAEIDANHYNPFCDPTWKTGTTLKAFEELYPRFRDAGDCNLMLHCYPFMIHIHGVEVYDKNVKDGPKIQIPWTEMCM